MKTAEVTDHIGKSGATDSSLDSEPADAGDGQNRAEDVFGALFAQGVGCHDSGGQTGVTPLHPH